MSSVDNLKLVRESIEHTLNEKNIMGCNEGYSCILDHTHTMKINSDFTKGSVENTLNFLGFIKNEHNHNNLFMPNFPFADAFAKEGEAGYITKSHVLRFLDLLIEGEKNLERAWRKSKDGKHG